MVYLLRNLLVGTENVARPKLYTLASDLKTNGKDVYVNKSWGKGEQGLVDWGDVMHTFSYSPPGGGPDHLGHQDSGPACWKL